MLIFVKAFYLRENSIAISPRRQSKVNPANENISGMKTVQAGISIMETMLRKDDEAAIMAKCFIIISESRY